MQESSEQKQYKFFQKFWRYGRRWFVANHALKRIVMSRLFILLLLLVALAFLFPFSMIVQNVDIPQEGELSKETIIAPFTFDIVKPPDVLQRERRDAAGAVLRVMDYDNRVLPGVRRRLADLRQALAAMNSEAPDSLPPAVDSLSNRPVSEQTLLLCKRRPWLVSYTIEIAGRILQNGVADVVLVSSLAERDALTKQYNASFDNYRIYDKKQVVLRRDGRQTLIGARSIPVKEAAIENAIAMLRQDPTFDTATLTVLAELLDVFLAPNVICNDNEYAVRQATAEGAVLPFKGKVIKDVEIVRKNQVVTADVVEQLLSLRSALMRTETAGNLRRILASNAGRFLLLMMALFFLIIYLAKDAPRVLADRRLCLALASIIALQFAIARLGIFLVTRLFERSNETAFTTPELLIPTTVAAVLVTLLFSERLSIMISLFCAVAFGVAQGFSLALFLFAFFGSVTAALAMKNVRYRFDFVKAMTPIIGVQILFVLLWHLVLGTFAFSGILRDCEYALINCVASVIMAFMATALYETLFDITTDMKLVELSDMNHPVLKRLSIEAAGTYNHSVLVGNLAESAAKFIGANALYARVASYYHDIGKINKADYFIENAVGEKKIHARLTPAMSSLIISSHVKEGVALAKKYHLPRTIQETILQHHGTGTVSIFYQKALKQDQHNQVKEEDFRYSGPMPQTRENAIIMLADCVEAASRSLGSTSPRILRDMVKKIIEEKFVASQFEQCDLTLRDLDKIVEGFMPILQGMFHTRIRYSEYSEKMTKEEL